MDGLSAGTRKSGRCREVAVNEGSTVIKIVIIRRRRRRNRRRIIVLSLRGRKNG